MGIKTTNQKEKEEITPMRVNKLTLSFPDENEKLFRDIYFQNSLTRIRFAFVLIALLYGAFGYLDTLVVKEYTSLFHFIRFGIVIPFSIFVLLLSFTKYFSKYWQELIGFCYVLGGAGIVVMLIKAPQNYTYYGGLMLIFISGYFFIGLRFLFATIGGWIIVILFTIGSLCFSQSKPEIIISNNFFFVSANLIGMFAAYIIEYYKRRDFFLRNQLNKQKDNIIEVNKSLESKVKKRTQELNFSKEKAEASEKLTSAFLANMSHEIRTPMNGILGFAEVLKEPGLSQQEQKQYLQIIEDSGIRMLNIINNIVDISKIESDQMKVSLSTTNIDKQLEFVHNFFEPEAQKKGLNLNLITARPQLQHDIETDREKLYAILTNLVKNAIKYTSTGSIEFGYTIENINSVCKLKFFVRDTGNGICADKKEAIFQRFIQVEIANKMANQGTGLGLAISKAYVEMLGGKIWVESEEGIGSNFIFTIPFTN